MGKQGFINIQCESRGARWGRGDALLFIVNREGSAGGGGRDELIFNVTPEEPGGGWGMH